MNKISWRYSGYWLLLLTFVCALSLYLYKINYKFVESVGDNYSYELISQSVFTKNPFKVNVKFDYYDDHPIFHHQRSFPPLYPIFLATGHLLFGNSIYVNFILTSIVGVLCALPVFWLGRKLADDLTGLLAAVLVVLSPELLQMSILGMSEPLFCLMSLFMIYYIYRWSESGHDKYLILAGIFCGLSILTRTNGLANIIAVLIFIIYAERETQFANSNYRGVRKVGLFLFALCLITLPWLLRNYLVFGDPFYYVGRFSAAFTPGSSEYGGLVQSGTPLNNPVEFSSVANHYFNALFIRLQLIFKETHVFLVFALFELIAGIKDRRFYRFLLITLFFNFAITVFAPYVKTRHLINLFPIIYLLAILYLGRLINMKKPIGNNQSLKLTWRWVTIFVILTGLVVNGYLGITSSSQRELFSPVYAKIGSWLKENTEPNDVIMTSKTASLAYHTQRPTIMFPRNATVEEVDIIVNKYNVKYLVSIYLNWEVVPSDFVFMKKFSMVTSRVKNPDDTYTINASHVYIYRKKT